VLTFVYQEIYGDQFEDDKARNENYRHYLDELHRRVMSGISEESVPAM